MRLVRISPGKFAAAHGVVPDVILDPNRQSRLQIITDAEYAAIATSGVIADELTENAEDFLFGSGVLVNAATGLIGYGTGAGGAVTQITSSSTGVTLNKPCGQITTVALTTAAGAEERFTVTNSLVDARSCIALGTTYNGAGLPAVSVVNVAAGAFDLVITNLHAANALNALMVINFALIKSVAA